MTPDRPISFNELTEYIRVVRADLQTGFTSINDRLDKLNGRTRENEKAIAILLDRSNTIETAQSTAVKVAMQSASHAESAGKRWGAMMGTAVGAGISALFAWLGK